MPDQTFDRPSAAQPAVDFAAHGAAHHADRHDVKLSVHARIRDLAETMRGACGMICVESDFHVVCEARDIGMEGTLTCLEHDDCGCRFKLTLSFGQFCQCPVRVQISKSLRK